MSMTLTTIKNKAVQDFTQSGSPTPYLDADCLLQFILNKDKTWILLNRNYEFSLDQEKAFLELVEKRKTGFPVAYITGKKEFYGIDFYVTPAVLIPKPDTEILIEEAVLKIKALKKDNLKIIDVCTGSGCVGLSVLHEVMKAGINAQLTLTDLSPEALSVAEKNARNIFDEEFVDSHIHFLNGDLLCGETGFDLVLSNPPYVPHKETEELLLDGRSEPRLALDGDIDKAVSDRLITSDGLTIIRRLVPQVYEALNSGGSFLMESGEYQTCQVRNLFTDAGFKDVHSVKDLSDMERITIGIKIGDKT